LHIDPIEAPVWLLVAASGSVLSWLCQAHPAALPAWAPWSFSWPEFLAFALSLWWFARGLIAAEPNAQPPLWRQGCFLLGVAVLYGVLQTRFDYMAQHMFLLNRLQHLVMHHLGPFLIALAWPGETISRGMPPILRELAHGRVIQATLRVVQQPVFSAVLFVALIALWLTPSIHFHAMLDPRLYAVMNWSMVIDGLLFWCMVLDPLPRPPARASFGARAAAALGVMFPQIALGAYIALNGRILYPYYDLCGRLYPSISGRYDQLAGGIVVWIPAAMMSIVSFLLVLNNLRRHEENVATTRDDGEQISGIIRSTSWTGR
jgi:putative membrane protein